MSEHSYSTDFYDYIDAGSRASARVVAQILSAEMRISSLLDVGAGHGAWAAEWRRTGLSDVIAVDGDYVDASRLAIPADNFVAHDLMEPLDLGRRFDLVQSLEVAEHLPNEVADSFIASLVRHGDIILFSAAVPHQGGEHHVNEQPPQYWRAKFTSHGFRAYDWVRPQLAGRKEVMPWYRFNTLIYANETGAGRLPPDIRGTCIADGAAVPIRGDWRWRARRTLVRLIPARFVKLAAMAKASVAARLRGHSPVSIR